MARLLVRIDHDHAFTYPLRRTVTNVGRGGWTRDVHVSVPDLSLAELHASIEAIEGGYKLVDRSGGRTLARGKPVGEITLVGGMELRFGDVEAVFDEAPEVEESPETLADDAPPGSLPERIWITAARPGARDRDVRVLLGEELTIGSAADAGLRLDDTKVSARHARIRREGNRLLLEDLGSRNGTFSGGNGIPACDLRLSAPVRIGPFDVWASAGDPPATPALENFEGILGADPGMKRVFEAIANVAPTELSVLVTGETGTGKEGAARAIHARSKRAARPFVTLNCSAIPAHLFESELFGHKKGAFTGALADRVGLYEEADGGTLLLDEIGDLAPELQPKLLRTLQEHEFRPVGSSKTCHADVRVIAATHRNLHHETNAGRFRADLYYRLVAGHVVLPPLRLRGEDAILLFEHFLAQGAGGAAPPSLSGAAKDRLRAHGWPGNVRELQSMAGRACLAARGGKQIGPEHVQFDEGAPAAPPASPGGIDPRGKTLAECEKEVLLRVLRYHRGNRTAAVAQLDISRGTLRKNLKEYGLDGEGKDEGGSRDDDATGVLSNGMTRTFREDRCLTAGDHIRVYRGGYWHHGVYCGWGEAIHYDGEGIDKLTATIRRTSLRSFLKGGTLEVVRHMRRLPVAETLSTDFRVGDRCNAHG